MCDCDLLWLSEYLSSHPVESTASIALCANPEEMKGVFVHQMDLDEDDCTGTTT